MKDPSFEAFRKQLAAVAEKKDRRALAGMVSAQFFWMGDKGDKADRPSKGPDRNNDKGGAGSWQMGGGKKGKN